MINSYNLFLSQQNKSRPKPPRRTLISQSSNLAFLKIIKKATQKVAFFIIGGEAEIRTLGGGRPSTVFKTAALNHSATSPVGVNSNISPFTRKTFSLIFYKGQAFLLLFSKIF